MALGIKFIVVPFHICKDGRIVAGEPLNCSDPSKAEREAEILAADPKNCGAIAFSRNPIRGPAIIIRQIGAVDGAALR